jgi:POT family proton-dependent oligopeptide transporter
MLIYRRLYWVTYNQINGNLNSQAKTMMLHGVPNDILQNLDPFAIMILIPLMDFVMYPMLRKRGINFTPIKRITAGFMLGTAAMVWTAVVQYYMYVSRRDGPRHLTNLYVVTKRLHAATTLVKRANRP